MCFIVADKDAIVKAVICAGLYPNVAKVTKPRRHPGKQGGYVKIFKISISPPPPHEREAADCSIQYCPSVTTTINWAIKKELSKKLLWVQWNNKTNEPCPSVRLSTPGCTTLYGRVLGYPSIDFVFLWHMERTYIGAVHKLSFLKHQFFLKLEFWRIFEKCWVWGLGVIIDGSTYGRVLGYLSMDSVYLWHIDRTYIRSLHRRIIIENL